MAHSDHLAAYVGAILGAASTPSAHVLRSTRESWQEQDFTVTAEETTYSFDDGTIIKCLAEQDSAPSDALCAECWISYEVLAQPRDRTISPGRISFTNACRQAHWLRYFSA
ncbi:hypothetical protein [Pseudomonas xantholysinigenes]|jgi:hypothetical protein|uniref:Uncharacterized protein n=1 Tax=Pseudomonas xantholysinigenes TaxID=2745490 RepID=A0A9E6U043_9PSED|nr:hypothetical protein [Pseudomonas xantholysinigenes]QXI40674.1 hypothetical protein HU772_011605 [Pseudomonas xantholysinigenes]